MSELSDKPKLSAYDVLEAEMKNKILNFYNSVHMSKQAKELVVNLPDKFKDSFEKEKEEVLQNTISAVVKEINNCIIRGEPPLIAMSLINSVLDKRVTALNKFLESKCRQLNRYMLLWEYKDKGCDRYLYISEGESCEVCDRLNGQIFDIADAEVGVNLQPMHPNCDCATEILDKNGNIEIVLGNLSSDEKSEEKNKLLDYLQTALVIAGLVPGIGEIADGTNAAIYALRGDYLNAGLSGAAMIPFAGWFSTGGKFAGKAIKAADKAIDAGKITKKATKEVLDGAGKIIPSKVSVSELVPNQNLRMGRNKFNKFVEEIKTNGIQEPIKYVQYNGKKYIVDGHHRLQAAKRLGITEVPVEEVKLPYLGYKNIDDLLSWGD